MNKNSHQNSAILTGMILFVVGVIFYLTFQVIKPFLGIIVTAVIFTIFVNPINKKLQKLTNVKLSAIITVLLFLLFMIAPLGILISNLFAEVITISKIIQSNPGWINSFQSQIEYQLSILQVPVYFSDINLNDQIYQSLTFLARNLGTFALRSGGVIVNLLLTSITMVFLLINQKNIAEYIEGLNLFPKKHFITITSRISETVNGTVRGYLLVVMLQLVVGIVGFSIFKIPASMLLGSIYGISSLLPVVGGVVLWMPIAVWLLFSGNYLGSLLLVLWFLTFSFLIENILTPKIIGQSTKLHQLLVMFAVFGGIQYFGLLGMILGPVVVALFFVGLGILKDTSNS